LEKKHATTEELLGQVFSMQSTPTLYTADLNEMAARIHWSLNIIALMQMAFGGSQAYDGSSDYAAVVA
jgi:hypothetical protein